MGLFLFGMTPGFLLQIENDVTIVSLLITAITALCGTIVFLFLYNKTLNKEIKSQSDIYSQTLQSVYKEQIKDNKEVVSNNTKAVIEHTNAVHDNSDISKELRDTIERSATEQTKALTEMRYWLKENFQAKK